MIYYAAGALVHKIVADLSRMVRVCLTNITPKKKAIEGGGKASRMTYGKEESLIAINQNAGKKQVAARLRSYRDCTGENETQLTEQSLLNAIKNHKVDAQRCALFYDTVRPPRGWDRILLIFSTWVFDFAVFSF